MRIHFKAQIQIGLRTTYQRTVDQKIDYLHCLKVDFPILSQLVKKLSVCVYDCRVCAVKGSRSGREMSQPERTVWPAVPGVGKVPIAGFKGGPGWL